MNLPITSGKRTCFSIHEELTNMRMSARNQLKGTVKEVKKGAVMAEVVVTLPDGQEIVSAITLGSAQELDLKAGDSVVAIIKSTEVMIGKE
ncbi:MAG TPA: molybdopterin-binding protein [Ktedonobacteraceae bacterium]